MVLRKASSYSHKRTRPLTRKSRSKSKAYVKVIPGSKVAKYHIGDQAGFRDGKHKFGVTLLSDERVVVRDNAIEAGRMFLTKMMDDGAPGQYYLAVKIYPHHMLRENKSAGGMAGADRISSGMTQSYGQIIGRAAIVRPGQPLFFISCVDEKGARLARDSLGMIRTKMPCRTKVVFEKIG